MRQKTVCVAPVQHHEARLREDAIPDVHIPAHVPEVQDDLKPQVGAPEVDAARPTNLPGVEHWSPVEVMRNRLRLLHAPVYGTKEHSLKRWLKIRRSDPKKKPLYNESWQLSVMLRKKNVPQRFFLLQNLRLAKSWTPTRLLTSRQNRGANIVMREGSLIQMEYFFLDATGEQAELQKETWSTALVVERVGGACRVSLRCRRKVLLKFWKTTFPGFLSEYLMQVLPTFLKRLFFERLRLYRPTAKQRHANGLKGWQESDKSPHVPERHLLILFREVVPETSTIGQVRTLRPHLESMHGVVFESQHVCLALAYTTCFVFDEQTLHTRQL